MRIDLYDADPYGQHGEVDGTSPYFDLPENAPNVGRTKADAKRIPFIWKTQRGDLYLIEDMNTNHLFNTVRMLFNNGLVPPAFRVGDFIRHDEIRTWDVEYVLKAHELMREELNYRLLGPPIVDQLNDMDDNLEFVCGSSASSFVY